MSKARSFAFTVNNWTDEEYASVSSLALDATYLVVGKETGAEGTPHLQGYVHFSSPRNFSALKKRLPRAHIEAAKGTAEQNRAYCSKGGDFREWGDQPHQGKRTELESTLETARASIGLARPMREVAEKHPREFVKFHRGIAAYINELVPDRDAAPEVVVFVGPTGVGKSYGARAWLGEKHPETWNPSMEKWFDGYCGQRNFLFEEFRGQITYGAMLSLTDCYTSKVQVKGSTVRFVAQRIAITSPILPWQWYPNRAADDKIEQLMRRITEIRLYRRRGEYDLVANPYKDDRKEEDTTDFPPFA